MKDYTKLKKGETITQIIPRQDSSILVLTSQGRVMLANVYKNRDNKTHFNLSELIVETEE